jgi:hypothetical protein
MKETKYKKWKICLICGKRFFAKRDYKKLNQKFCSRKCFGKIQIGNRLWDNSKSKENQFKKGHKVQLGKHWKVKDTSKMKGRIPWNKEKKVSPEIRIKMREAAKKRNPRSYLKNLEKAMGRAPKGKNHWNWKGGITPERTHIWNSEEYSQWRKEIYKKDNWTCQKCSDNSGNNLIPHHIESFADYLKLRFDVNNGITLCKNCHTYFHSKYGTHHNNRKQLEEFLNEKQESIITTRGRQVMVSGIS